VLILQRRIGETLDIGPEIRITLIAVDSHSARIGIVAPVALLPHAEETHERAQEQRDKSHISWR
jgi:carbon storage regulator